MANLFDGLQAAAYNAIATSMGYPATWTPSNGGAVLTGTMLFNEPTQKADISDDEYDAITTKCEFLYAAFPGLFEAVQATKREVVNINGIDYYAYKADRKYDGKTVILKIEPKRS